ncbi:MAG: hypothetical protein JHD05_05205, partial [Thermoleophilia bacterium]|nr:hypothetical protein [Thermoleophilia bacterium]
MSDDTQLGRLETADSSRGTWASGLVRVRRDRAAMLSLVVLLVIIIATLLAPVYAAKVAK